MSGYIEGVLVLLAVNVVFAYGAFRRSRPGNSTWVSPASARSAPMRRPT